MTSNDLEITHLQALSPRFPVKLKGALEWNLKGYRPMPIKPQSKASRFKYKEWLEDLNAQKIYQHWLSHQDDDVALYCGDDLVVFDCDSQQAEDRLTRIQKEFGLYSNLITRTRKGSHHYYRRPKEVQARNHSCNTETDPAGIDIKCGNQYVIAPPSEGKTLLSDSAPPLTDLIEVTQTFFEAVMLANGVQSFKTGIDEEPQSACKPIGDTIERLSVYLDHLDPDDDGYESWVKTLMAIFNATNGSPEGLSLAIEWSSKGEKYKGSRDIETRWSGFKLGGHVITEAFIASRLIRDGLSPIELLGHELGPDFERIDTSEAPATNYKNYFSRFSAVPHLDYLRTLKREVKPILGPLAVDGELTIISAGPNSGKTLITLSLLFKEITENGLDPARVAYLDFDDSMNDFIEKADLASKYGIEFVAPSTTLDGRAQSLDPANFIEHLQHCISEGSANGTIIILDTVKKFVDTIQKNDVRNFMIACTNFCAAGGSLILLGHSNKNTNPKREVTFEGTGDFLSDAHRMWQCSCVDNPDGTRVTTFHLIKSRSPGDEHVEIQFTHSIKQGYLDRLNSVEILSCGTRRIEESSGDLIDLTEAPRITDEMIIHAIKGQLEDGSQNQTAITDAVRKDLGISKERVRKVLIEHDGSDPEASLWTSVKGLRNATIYSLLTD